jgi:UDP-GlcNAc:undecaprenyl-phosphate/decaprenyl-phosphate GlcNAc-1-phosphate transferase
VHPSLEYALVWCVAAAGVLLLTPLARLLATRWGAIATPRDRDVHAFAIPRLGGVAIYAGFGLAILVAHSLPTLRSTFTADNQILGVMVAGAVLLVLGMLDDRYELDSLTKLAGQVLASGIMVVYGGVQFTAIYLPFGPGFVSLGLDVGFPVTVLFTVVTINALNFIDGLDGLAAGVSAITALAFFAYAYHLADLGYTDVTSSALLLSAALAGACVGFLFHNFAPARIFMGDSGSMFVGLVLSACAASAVAQTDPQTYGTALGALPLYVPLLTFLFVLALPFVDLLLAIVRRVSRGESPFKPDKQHLHHRLLQRGHSHRRAVLMLYFWSALLAVGGVSLSISQRPLLVGVVVGVLAVIGLIGSLVPQIGIRRHPPRVVP